MISELLQQTLCWKTEHFLVGINVPLLPPLFELQVGLPKKKFFLQSLLLLI